MRKFLGILALLFLPVFSPANENCEYLQKVSVTVKSRSSEGSGCIVVHEMLLEEGSKEKEKVAFILTAGHVIDNLRKTREIINPNGDKKTLVEFNDAAIVKEFRQRGRRVGETKIDAKVIKYSDADNGEDLAVLLVRFYGGELTENTTVFFVKDNPDDEVVRVGTKLWHCGSLLGQDGANSITDGVMSQSGRVYQNQVYDQSTVNAFPGSSGGGIWMEMKDGGTPQYVGMVVRGSGETFNLFVPMRRIHKWVRDNELEWLINPKLPKPTLNKVLEMNPETVSVKRNGSSVDVDGQTFYFLDGAHSHLFEGMITD